MGAASFYQHRECADAVAALRSQRAENDGYKPMLAVSSGGTFTRKSKAKKPPSRVQRLRNELRKRKKLRNVAFE